MADSSGRDFFNSFFSSALDVAKLEDPSLNGQLSVATAHASSSDANKATLDCGRDPGPSTEEMLEYAKGPRQATVAAETAIAATGAGPSTDASTTQSARRLPAPNDGVLTQDSKADNFEVALERRLSLVNKVKDLDRGHGDDETEERRRRGLNNLSRSTSGVRTPVMDKDGLGWPAKSTLTRLNSTPLEAAQTSARLSAAVKTILECLGEDPEREGLKRTPERYAKALLWMTRGYEERLSGEFRLFETVKGKVS